MGKHRGREKITVETLLQLKRNERPASDFWESFDQDFHRRRLNALVRKPSLGDYIWHHGIKALAFGIPALLLVGLTVFWSQTQSPANRQLLVADETPALTTANLVEEEQAGAFAGPRPAVKTSLSSSQFVLDAIEHNASGAANFRKVLYTPAIRLSTPTGASYVRDNLSSSSYQVTTADLKLGRNF